MENLHGHYSHTLMYFHYTETKKQLPVRSGLLLWTADWWPSVNGQALYVMKTLECDHNINNKMYFN